MTARILVAEDERAIKLAIRGLLRRDGYEVELADNGEAAIRKIKEMPLDLVLTDLALGQGPSGMDVLRFAKQHRPEAAVVMITAHGTEKIAVEAMKLGAADYLTKPFEEEELEATLHNVLERRALLSERDRLASELDGAAENAVWASPAMCRVRDLLEADEAERRSKGRFAQINVWRPIRGPVRRAPLALADAQSIAARDLVPVDLVYTDRVGEIYHGAYNPDHRWYYFPEMAADEAVLIKGYDSEEDGRARFTLHTAFDDPTTTADAEPRESIEVRVLAFFDDWIPLDG